MRHDRVQVRVVKASDGTVLGDRVQVADTFWARFRGLMGAPPLQPGEGLLLDPCASVHMLFMRYPIDVAFVDADLTVVACGHALPPWTGLSSGRHRGARKALELPAGTLAAAGVIPGTRLTLERIPLPESPSSRSG